MQSMIIVSHDQEGYIRVKMYKSISSESTEEVACPLHECVFVGDVRQLSALLRQHDVARQDRHGNTALHLAVMLGRKECVQLLLAHGAPVKLKNLAGWSPLAEAISYGDRQTISSLVRKLKQQAREQMEARRPDLIRALTQINDFYMELRWDFHSWVPLVSRLLPSDVCKIYKAGSGIRVDTTLVDFSNMKWERGDISFIFQGDKPPGETFIFLDNKANVYQHVRYEENKTKIEDRVDSLMSRDITSAKMSTKGIIFTRAQSGWIFREDRTEMAGLYRSEVYSVSGLVLKSRKRREHLSPDDLYKNKAIIDSFARGSTQHLDLIDDLPRRESLVPPSASGVDWMTYISSPPGQHPILGREIVSTESSKNFRATIAMSDDFPLTVDMLLNVLEVVAPIKHFAKLRQFVAMKLPSGFPVKTEIPILPTITASVTFERCYFMEVSPELFNIPADYNEDPHRFPKKRI